MEGHETEPEDKDPFRLGDDPGWRPGPRDGRPDGLVALRLVFIQMVVGLVLVGLIVVVLADDLDARISGWLGAAAVVVVGIGGLVMVRFVPVHLDCSDELALSRSWRSRFFARMFASELAALTGFLAFVLSGRPALYPLGLVFTAVGLAVSGPMRANLIHDQEQLALDGCPIPLVPALRHPITRDTR